MLLASTEPYSVTGWIGPPCTFSETCEYTPTTFEVAAPKSDVMPSKTEGPV